MKISNPTKALVLLVGMCTTAGSYVRIQIARNRRHSRSQSPRGLVSQSHSRIRSSNSNWSIAPTSQWDFLRTPKSYVSSATDHNANFIEEKKREGDKDETVPAYMSTW